MRNDRTYRNLTAGEIETLTGNGCSAGDWQQIRVVAQFTATHCVNVHFSGTVQLGCFVNTVTLPSGIEFHSGLYNTRIHNCQIEDNVLIRNIADSICNYTIEDDVIINDVRRLTVNGPTAFGNGVRLAVVNENAGRTIAMFDRLSAPLAYVMAMYRERKELISKLETQIDEYTEQITTSQGVIARGAQLSNCGVITNVQIGAKAVLDGVCELTHGTIHSCEQDPAYIGAGVIAHDFIFCEGSHVTKMVLLDRCFVGQAVHLSKGFSAVDCAFFANCDFEQGECCSVLAGPYTVSHHKATLLIAGIYSFYNAGSGTNNSNHMYKLGPLSQGVLERGCKSGSSSYLLWPVRLGAFTLIAGKHTARGDLSALPFSYLMERKGQSHLLPGLNLGKAGTLRDGQKWPGRDRRKLKRKLDQIVFEIVNPYTAGKMLEGMDLLSQLLIKTSDENKSLTYQEFNIANATNGMLIYEAALDAYFARILIDRLTVECNKGSALIDKCRTFDELRQILHRRIDMGTHDWVDLAGLIAPAEAVQELLEDIEAERFWSLEIVRERFEALHENVDEYEWAWAASQMENKVEAGINHWTVEDFIRIIERGGAAEEQFSQMQYNDALKEFAPTALIGFGIDGHEETAETDFAAVVGTYEDNEFIQTIQDNLLKKQTTASQILKKLKNLE